MRVISAEEGVERKAHNDPALASPDQRRQAAERFDRARTEHTSARSRLLIATRVENDAQGQADAALAAYQRARVEARRATVLLRQRQREATATKLAMQRALEWVARLEALDPYPDGDQPSSALDGRPGPAFGAVDATAPTDEASLIV